MAGRTIEFPDSLGLTKPPDMCCPSSNALGISAELLFDEALGRDCHGMEVEMDQHLWTEGPLRSTPTGRNQPSRFASVAQLSAAIVHQLNEPLTSMLVNAQAAKRWLAAEPPNLTEAIASIERISREARAAGRDMGQIQALVNQSSLDKREASIPDLMSEAVRMVLEDPKLREVPIQCHCDESLPTVCVDLITLREVLINLISNAIEALKDTGHPPLVKVQAAVNDESKMVIQVIDNGPGICETEEIFDAFPTTRTRRVRISLAMSRAIAEAHGGRLWAEENASGGATYCLALPVSSRNQTSARA